METVQSREAAVNQAVLIPVLTGKYLPDWLSHELIFFDLREASVSQLVEELVRKAFYEDSSKLGSLHNKAENCQVMIRSDLYSGANNQFIRETEEKLQSLGFRVE